MEFAGYSLFEWLVLVEHELLLFAGIFFLLGAIDEVAVDLTWIWLRLTGKTRGIRVERDKARGAKLSGQAVIFIPAWKEASVIGANIRHTLSAWPQDNLRLYVGVYGNDAETLAAALHGAAIDPRVRLVVHDTEGPTTKADCLNRLYSALCEDEARSGEEARLVVLHDAEDMVDPAALPLIDRAIANAEFVQLPVLPAPQSDAHWVANHYCDEFAEAHGKALVVRDALGVSLPAAGVGCAFSRSTLQALAEQPDMNGSPFSVESLTEDYELGLRIKAMGGRSQFLRVRDEDGRLVATRACFPAQLSTAVRQKTRWIHGIAFQGWDRLGWSGGLAERWMRMRDRRGPLTALVLFVAYTMLALAAVIAIWAYFTDRPMIALSPALKWLLILNFASFVWRAVFRFVFTARDYGRTKGLLAILRIPLANIITIMAGRRAIASYVRSLAGTRPEWDKTEHDVHPALLAHSEAPA